MVFPLTTVQTCIIPGYVRRPRRAAGRRRGRKSSDGSDRGGWHNARRSGRNRQASQRRRDEDLSAGRSGEQICEPEYSRTALACAFDRRCHRIWDRLYDPRAQINLCQELCARRSCSSNLRKLGPGFSLNRGPSSERSWRSPAPWRGATLFRRIISGNGVRGTESS
jgi:hypothetical protein